MRIVSIVAFAVMLALPAQAATICQQIGTMIYCTSTPDPTPQTTICQYIGGMLYCS